MAQTQTTQDTLFDIAVIGAGPCGMTAGMYAARAGLSVSVFERLSPGGQVGTTEFVENYPGFAEGIGGFDLAFAMKQQAERFGARTVGEEVFSAELTGKEKVLTTGFGSYRAKSVIVATGARPRKLGLACEDELQGKGVSYCATCDGNFFRGREVFIVGGGDTAVADAIYLARICTKVTLIHRRDTLRATAVYYDHLMALDNVEIAWNTVVKEILAKDGVVGGVRLENLGTGQVRTREGAALFVAVGSEPNTEFLEGALGLDAAGYIIADERGATNIAGVYAAGDVRTKSLRQIATAVSDGANTADAAAEHLSS